MTKTTKNFDQLLAEKCAQLDTGNANDEVCASWSVIVPIFRRALKELGCNIVHIGRMP